MNGRTNKQEFAALCSLYDKYIDQLMKYIHEGILEGKQVAKLKTICPITDLNMVIAETLLANAVRVNQREEIECTVESK